ncbi:alpha/beta hydrolase [Mesoplasma syrphidae]|uniref:Alpha/beta hydrolase n=1 Tax=Mesoplasma syrphidae TaxID=225999 RepID=A0A2K9BZN3_9MOLU|nr:alpha/beta hydrolase [Mesoplasma syrphidae]AUF83818.1 alpha/beta hydrolase [Mesoplasma syrphidae]
MGNKLFSRVNRITSRVYADLENILFSGFKKRSNVYLYPEIKKMNKIMRKFYKRPQLQIDVSSNLLPVKFETSDGVILTGVQYITNPNSKKWIIANHWFGGHKYWGLYWARPFIELGYNILAYDFRNHGDSEKEQYTTMGILEREDLLAAMKWLYENHEYEILGLTGASMGAFTINYTSVKDTELMKKYKVKFAISEISYGSIRTLLAHTRSSWLSKFIRKKSTKKVIDKILASQIKDTKLDWEDLNVFDYYENKNVMPNFPIFYSHGKNDLITPPYDSIRMYMDRKPNSPNDEILIYDYSQHCFSLMTHFYQTTYHWLKFENKIVKDDDATAKAMKYFGIDQEMLDSNFYEAKELSTYWSEKPSTKVLVKSRGKNE